MKKIISVLLAAAMLFCALPVLANDAAPDTADTVNRDKPIIILKFDDMGAKAHTQNFNRTAELLAKYDATGGFGIIGQWFDRDDNQAELDAIKAWNKQGIEIWHHGYYHSQEEYSTNPYEKQLEDFKRTMDLVKDKCQIEITSFGSPYNNATDTTLQVIKDNFPQIKCIMLAPNSNSISSAVHFTARCDIEPKTGTASYDTFVANYKNKKRLSYLVVQSHSGYWNDESFKEFERVLNFLKNEGCTFMTPTQAAEDYIKTREQAQDTPKQIEVKIKSEYLDFDTKPTVINNRTMVPFRKIFEALGADVSYDSDTGSGIAVKDGTEIKITNDSPKAYINGAENALDSPATIIDNRFLVPVRFVSEALGCFVHWDDEQKTVLIIPNLKPREFGTDEIEIADCTFNDFYREPGEIGQYTYDGDPSTVWSCEGKGRYVCYELKEPSMVKDVCIMWNKGDARKAYFEIHVSQDGENFEKVYEGESAGNVKDDFENVTISKQAKFVKIVCNQNSASTWNAIKEIKFTK